MQNPFKNLFKKVPYALKTRKVLMRGMTMIEIIIILLITALLFSLVIMETNALATSKKQSYEDIAYHIANKQMETLRATAYTSLPASASISSTDLARIPSGSGSFTATDYPGYTGIKKIIVTVTWNDGTSKSVAVQTLVSDSGI